jgi:Uma2 family endonuclease
VDNESGVRPDSGRLSPGDPEPLTRDRDEEESRMAQPVEHVSYGQGWTVADLDRIQEDGHRYELIDGVVHVSPSPTDEHQEAAGVLWMRLRSMAPPGFRATQGVGVITAPDGFLIPDVLVVRGDQVRKRGNFPAAEVVLAVEVVSPSTRSIDRWHKPKLYAAAGIPFFWRVELDPLHAVAYQLAGDGDYAEVTRAEAGNLLRLSEPFGVEFDPADLTL